MPVISSDGDFDVLEDVLDFNISPINSNARAAPLRCWGRGAKRPPLSEIWIPAHLLQCKTSDNNEVDNYSRHILSDPLRHKGGFSIVPFESLSSVQDASDSEIYFSDVEDHFDCDKVTCDSLHNKHIVDLPGNQINCKDNLHKLKPIESSSSDGSNTSNNFSLPDIDECNMEPETANGKEIVSDVNNSSKENKPPISNKCNRIIENASSEVSCSVQSTAISVIDENIYNKITSCDLNSQNNKVNSIDGFNSEEFFDSEPFNDNGSLNEDLWDSGKCKVNPKIPPSKNQLHRDLKVFSAPKGTSSTDQNLTFNYHVKKKTLEKSSSEVKKRHNKQRDSRINRQTFDKNISANVLHPIQNVELHTVNKDTSENIQRFFDMSHRTNPNSSRVQEREHFWEIPTDQITDGKNVDPSSQRVKSMHFTSPKKFGKSNILPCDDFSFNLNSELDANINSKDEKWHWNARSEQLNVKNNSDSVAIAKPDFFVEHFANFDRNAKKGLAVDCQEEFPDLPSSKTGSQGSEKDSIWSSKPILSFKSIASSLVIPGARDENSYKINAKCESNGEKKQAVDDKILIIKNIPEEVGYEELKNVLSGYGEVKKLSLVTYNKKTTAQVQIDCDLDWIVECLNGSYPFGACSDPLDCHLI